MGCQKQINLFDLPNDYNDGETRTYKPILTVSENQKGVLDVDTVKGCTRGMAAYPEGGCYGECYARKGSLRSGIDFSVAISRRLTASVSIDVFCAVRDFRANWYRIGVSGDPCHDWENTLEVCEFLAPTNKVPVIITKHWVALKDEHVARFKALGSVFNTSVSGIDTDAETKHRVKQMMRLREAGLVSSCRVVTCKYGETEWAKAAQKKQDYLMGLGDIIDTPLRASSINPRVISGDIILERIDDALGWKFISLHSRSAYLGTCEGCPDQCGIPKSL